MKRATWKENDFPRPITRKMLSGNCGALFLRFSALSSIWSKYFYKLFLFSFAYARAIFSARLEIQGFFVNKSGRYRNKKCFMRDCLKRNWTFLFLGWIFQLIKIYLKWNGRSTNNLIKINDAAYWVFRMENLFISVKKFSDRTKSQLFYVLHL